jgi:hypothetical protein
VSTVWQQFPTDSDLRRLLDQCRAQREPPDYIEFARMVLRRYGVQIAWLPAEQAETPTPQQESTMTRDCDPVEQTLRQDRLDDLYSKDGRHDPSHPLHSVYTGLAEKYREQDSAPAH